MATRLPTYQRQISSGAGSMPMARATSAVSAADPTASALGNLAQVGQHGVAVFRAREDQELQNVGAVQVANVLSQGDVYWQANMGERFKGYKVGDPDMREAIGQDFDTWASQQIEKLPTEQSKKYFQTHAASMKASLQKNAYTFQEKMFGDKMNAETAAGQQADENIVASDSSKFNEIYARRMETVLARTDLSEGDKIKFADKYRRGLSLAAERGELERNPSEWYKKRFGTFDPGVGGAGGAGGALPATGTKTVADAIYSQESSSGRANTSSVNSQNVTGPMQMQEATFNGMKDLGLIPRNYEWKNPAQNKEAGYKWVEYLGNKYGGDPEKVAAAYYGGEGAVNADGSINRHWINKKRPQDPSVGEYVDSVMAKIKANPGGIAEQEDAARAPNGTPSPSMPEGWSKVGGTPTTENGMIEAGNIDLTTRPKVKNADGSTSTVRSIGFNIDGQEVLIPSVVNGKVLSDDEAIEEYRKTGKHLGKFSSIEASNAYAEKLHNQQEAMYLGTQKPDAIPQPKTYVDMDWEQQLQLKAAAESKLRQQESQFKAGAERVLHDAVAMHHSGQQDPFNLNKDYFTRAFGDQGARMYDDYLASREMAGDIAQFKTMSAADIRGTLEVSKPTPGLGYAGQEQRYNNRVKAANMIMDARAKDPAGYAAANSDALKSQLKEMESAPQEQRPQLLQRYISNSLAEQQRLGIAEPKILTPQQSDNIGMQASRATRPEDSANLIAGLERDYGQYFPQAFNQLVKEEKISNELLVIPNLPSQAARESVSRLSRIKEKELTVGIESSDQKTIKEGVETKMRDFARAVPMMSLQAANVTNSYESIIRKRAYELAQGGTKPSDAVDQSYAMVLGHYDFDKTARYPKGTDQSMVNYGTRTVMNEKLGDIDVPRDITGARSPDEVRKEWISTVQANPLWYTSDDDGGLELWAVGNNGVKYRVTRDGQQVKYSWNDLKAMQPSGFQRPAVLGGINNQLYTNEQKLQERQRQQAKEQAAAARGFTAQ